MSSENSLKFSLGNSSEEFVRGRAKVYFFNDNIGYMYEICSVMSDSLRPYGGVHQAPLSMECSRKEYRNVLPFPPLRILPDPGIEPASSSLKADSLGLSHLGSPPLRRSHYDQKGFTMHKTVIQFHRVKIHVTGEG